MAVIGTQSSNPGWVKASGSNDDGTIMGAGNISATGPITSDIGINTLADNVGETVIGSKVVTNDGTEGSTTDSVGLQEAASAGTLAFNPSPTGTRSETFVIHGFTTKLSNVANTSILGGTRIGDGTYDNIQGTIQASSGTFSNPNNTFDATALPSTEITPGYTKSPGGASYTLINPADGSDAEANEIFPTRTLPGELTMHFGSGAKPSTFEYKAKNANE